MKKIVLAWLLALPVPLCLAHEESHEPSIRVSGHAIVMAQPDQAEIDLGVVTEAKAAAMAANQNARRFDKVLAELKKTLGPDASIKTLSYSLYPNYRYPKEGGKPEIIGYTASNIVRVTLARLDDVGKAIDTAIQAGANTVHRLQYTLRDEQAAQASALREAAANARAKAETLAESLSLTITRVLSVSENQSSPITPLRRDFALAEARSAATPVEPGTIEVRAEVLLEVAVTAK